MRLDPAAVDALFLDLGNTLVSMDFVLLTEVLATHGVATTPPALARAEAATRPALSRFLAGGRPEWRDTFTFYVDGILERLGGVAATTRAVLAPRLADEIRRTIPTQRLWSAVLPGVPAALAALRDAGLRLVVVTNSDGTAEQGLVDRGLRAHVDHVVDSAVVGAEKPDRAIFQHALAVAGSTPERTLDVGDLYAVDVLGARAAGLQALLLDPHGDWPDVDCERAPDVPALARTLLAGRDACAR
ncbi:MAG TPA: HAD family hydrolase [Candidatus Binatia bacterium]|nr:HAD family hydrolase [Candidatus Binatia bacterium]